MGYLYLYTVDGAGSTMYSGCLSVCVCVHICSYTFDWLAVIFSFFLLLGYCFLCHLFDSLLTGLLGGFWQNLVLLLLHPFNGHFSRTTWVSQYRKAKTILDLNGARDDGVWGCSGISRTIRKQSAPRSRQITTPTPYRSTFFACRMLFLMPNQQCQSTEGKFH